MRWKIADAHSDLVVVQRASSTAEERAKALTPRDAALRLQSLLASLRGNDVARLAQMIEDGHATSSPRGRPIDVSVLRDKLSRKLTTQQIFVVDTPRRRVVKVLEEPVDVLGPQDEPTSWISIELVDDDGNPVPNMAFQITDADGKLWNGTTNSAGKARYDGMNPGTCKVTFPTLDAADWAKA